MIFGGLGGQNKRSLGIQWVDTSISERLQIRRCSGVCVLSACPAYTVSLAREHGVMKFSSWICEASASSNL